MTRTLRSTALAMLVLGPVAAAAQATPPPDTLVFGTPPQGRLINLSDCSPTTTATVKLTGTITTDGTAYAPSGSYKVFASTTAPTQSGTSGSWICSTQDGVPTTATKAGPVTASPLVPASGTTAIAPAINANLSDILTMTGNSCSSSDGTPIWVCVHWFDPSGVQHGSAWGSMQLQLGVPGSPTGVTVGPDDSSLQVSWTAPTSSTTAAYYVIHADTIDARDPIKNHESGNETGTSASIGSLVNGVTYEVTVVAFSNGGNPSLPSSPAVPGMPVPTESFWGYYKLQGGREQGGCATAGGGLLALAGAAFALRRRRS